MSPSPYHRRIDDEPRWRQPQQLTNAVLPPSHRPWLLDDGSLTQRLASLNRGAFSVRRLYQGWHVPLPSERILLGVPGRELALVREVALLLDEQPMVFARSVFPVATLKGSLAHLRKLRNRSLGAILFRHPGMHRSPFELARIAGDCPYLPESLHQEDPAWGRRSRFDIKGHALMVSEVFLREFSPWQSIMPVHRSQRGRVNAAIGRTNH